MTSPARPLAVGLVHHRAGTPRIDRSWARALVVRHAAEARLQLVDILEIEDLVETDDADATQDWAARTGDTLRRLARLVELTRAYALVTHGVPPRLAAGVVGQLGLRHDPVPPRSAENTPRNMARAYAHQPG